MLLNKRLNFGIQQLYFSLISKPISLLQCVHVRRVYLSYGIRPFSKSDTISILAFTLRP